jgi:hypothetical protein
MELENENTKADFGSSEDASPYTGPEHRMCQRRETVDRREMVRFELGKEQRRSGQDRRAPNSVWENREMY